MGNKFDFFANLPYLIFAVLFVLVFALFVWAIILILTAKGDETKNKKGRKFLFNAFVGLFVVLIIVLVFFVVSDLLNRGAALSPSVASSGDLPVPPVGSFPPGPSYTKLGDYYFAGPYALSSTNVINDAAVYAVLCKKATGYDIIYINESDTQNQLLKSENYGCWKGKCETKNLYVGIMWASPKNYNALQRKEISDHLQAQLQPPCPLPS